MDGMPYARIASNKELCPESHKNSFFGFHHSGDAQVVHPFFDSPECGYRDIIDNTYPAYGLTYEKFRVFNIYWSKGRGIFEGDLSPEYLMK